MPEINAQSSLGPLISAVLLWVLVVGCFVLLALLARSVRRASKGSKPGYVLHGRARSLNGHMPYRLEIAQELRRSHSQFLWEELGRGRAANAFLVDSNQGPVHVEVDAQTEFVIDQLSETYWEGPTRRTRAIVLRDGDEAWIECVAEPLHAGQPVHARRVLVRAPDAHQRSVRLRARGALWLGGLGVVVALVISHQSILCSALGTDTEATVLALQEDHSGERVHYEVEFQTVSGMATADDASAMAFSRLQVGQTIPAREVFGSAWLSGIGHGPRAYLYSYMFSSLGLLQLLMLMGAYRKKPMGANAIRELNNAPMPEGALGMWIRSES